MQIHTFTATEAARKFGPLLDEAQKRPVEIQKQGKSFAFLVSAEFFQAIEDAYWIKEALDAKKEGSLTVEESERSLERMRKKHAKLKKKQASR